jgi:hypothetical protein
MTKNKSDLDAHFEARLTKLVLEIGRRALKVASLARQVANQTLALLDRLAHGRTGKSKKGGKMTNQEMRT